MTTSYPFENSPAQNPKTSNCLAHGIKSTTYRITNVLNVLTPDQNRSESFE